MSGDRVVYARGIGVSNIETGAPVAPGMVFRIGSVTKIFTAALLLSLAEERKLGIGEPIGKYVKGRNPETEEVPKWSLPVSEAEGGNYVGTYMRPDSERPETASIFLRDDKLYLRALGFEQPITKVSADGFSVAVPGYRMPWKFTLLPGAGGGAEYPCLSLGVMKRVQDGKTTTSMKPSLN